MEVMMLYCLLVPIPICCGGSTYRMPTFTERSCYIFLWKACSWRSYRWGLSLGWWLPSECRLVWKNAWQCFWHLRWGKTHRGQYFKSLFAIFRCPPHWLQYLSHIFAFINQEVEEILELLKSTWRILGITETIHDTCYAWVLFRQVKH